jgi:hypothetical protein
MCRAGNVPSAIVRAQATAKSARRKERDLQETNSSEAVARCRARRRRATSKCQAWVFDATFGWFTCSCGAWLIPNCCIMDIRFQLAHSSTIFDPSRR